MIHMHTNASSLGFIENIGVPEMVIVMLAVLLLFGGKKLPEMARGIGRGIRQFKEELHGVQSQIARHVDDESDTAGRAPERPDQAGKDPPAGPDEPKSGPTGG